MFFGIARCFASLSRSKKDSLAQELRRRDAREYVNPIRRSLPVIPRSCQPTDRRQESNCTLSIRFYPALVENSFKAKARKTYCCIRVSLSEAREGAGNEKGWATTCKVRIEAWVYHTYTGWMVVMSSLGLEERRIGVGVDRPIEIWIGEDADAIGGVGAGKIYDSPQQNPRTRKDLWIS